MLRLCTTATDTYVLTLKQAYRSELSFYHVPGYAYPELRTSCHLTREVSKSQRWVFVK